MPLIKVSANSFSGQTLYVGLDVHKKNWLVSILSDHHELKTMSTDPILIFWQSFFSRTIPEPIIKPSRKKSGRKTK